jgi:MFS family permease
LVFAPANFISPYIVQLIGEKFSLILGALCYCIYVAANIKVTEPTLLGASAIIGFGAAVLWTAQGSVVMHSSTKEKLGSYNGLFFGLFQWAQVIGNLLAGILLSHGTNNSTLFIILTIVGGCSLIGFLFIRQFKVEDVDAPQMSISERFSQTFKLMVTREMIMLYLAMIYSGISQSYMFGVFPKTRPKNDVGYIMAVFGAADVLGSFVAGYVSDRLGRMPIVFTCAVSMTAGSLIFFMQYLDLISMEDKYLSYVIAILLGIADSGFNTQLYSILGAIFADRVEPAIGAFKFFQAGSTAVLFFLGPYVSQVFYFATTMSFLWTGTLLFFVLDAQYGKASNLKTAHQYSHIQTE